jgi:O-acetyl-ADP-ribose deacetylase (regulator of RNase III)
MPIEIKKGNIFNSECQTLVNTVNCQGVMGKGVALEFSYRFPDMEQKYKKLCEDKKISVGKLWIYKTSETWILNFPTKNAWSQPSKLEYIELGLKNFTANYKPENIKSIAFPQLGTSSGGLDWAKVRDLMNKYLSQVDIPVEIYEYDGKAKDKLYAQFLREAGELSVKDLKSRLALNDKQADLVYEAIRLNEITNFTILRNIKGLGEKTVERIYSFVLKDKNGVQQTDSQYTLFDNKK